ncbi:MAG: 5-(carboxyamino)imidazole ribonucleotide mutase [Candidatus Omnitrophica bacterium]|nr:5-(carboxyamino)imidazole ribonucleotide mutase [Candidatus Omnitrophota bacterium]
MKKIDVAVIMGSKFDLSVAREAEKILKEFKVKCEMKVLSAHRTPKATVKYVEGAENKGIKVIIALAGKAAHLAGVIAAHTALPVIGVPMDTRDLKGIDSLFSTVQMPAGIPVACMAIGTTGAKNAALYAIEILALSDKMLGKRLLGYRKEQTRSILKTKI